MDITENEDGSFTATPEDFRECDYALDQSFDCWYTGATHAVGYNVAGLTGRYVSEVCEAHLSTELHELRARNQPPYAVLPETIITTPLYDGGDD